MNRHEELLHALHGARNPFHGFPDLQWKSADPNWGSGHAWLPETIEAEKPRTIVEIGTFVGGSAIAMAKKIADLKIDSAVICIDTFLGGIDHHLKAPELLGWHFGRPSLYYNFMANVIVAGMTNYVVPLPLDSVNAGRLLAARLIKADMIYVDGSHEEEDVKRDLEFYYNEILVPGGIMIIDDVTGHFPGIIKAVEEFCTINMLTPDSNLEKVRIRKPV